MRTYKNRGASVPRRGKINLDEGVGAGCSSVNEPSIELNFLDLEQGIPDPTDYYPYYDIAEGSHKKVTGGSLPLYVANPNILSQYELTLIERIEPAVPTSSIVFSSIPGTFDGLLLIIENPRVVSPDPDKIIRMFCNTVSTDNAYPNGRVFSNPPTNSRATARPRIFSLNSNDPPEAYAMTTIEIYNYATTDFSPMRIFTSSETSVGYEYVVFQREQIITTLTLLEAFGNDIAGSGRYDLFGVIIP